MAPSLRRYEPRDYAHFMALDLETALDAAGAVTEEERARLRDLWPRTRAERHGLAEGLMPLPGVEIWVLEADGRYLGHLWLTEKHDPTADGRVLEVSTMGIVRDARGQGLGRLLMNKAEATARERRIGCIELSVAGNNRRARDLYRDLGYETTSRRMRKRLRDPDDAAGAPPAKPPLA